MKKVLAIMAIAGLMVACNSKSDKKADEAKDSTAKMMDTAASKMMDTASKMVDTTSKMADTTKPKM